MKSYRIGVLVKVDMTLDAGSLEEALDRAEARLMLTTLQPEHILETLVIPTGERSITIRGGQRP